MTVAKLSPREAIYEQHTCQSLVKGAKVVPLALFSDRPWGKGQTVTKLARIHADKAPNWSQTQLEVIRRAGELCPEAFRHLERLMQLDGRQSQVAHSACRTVLEVAMKVPAPEQARSELARLLEDLESKPPRVQAAVLRQLADGLEAE